MNHMISSPTSSSRASGSGSSFPTTPKSSGNHHRPQGQRTPNGRQRKAQSSSPQSLNPFASSSICSSPSARNVPMPPIEWLNKLQVPSDETLSRPSSCISDTSSSTSTSSLASMSSGAQSISPNASIPSSPVSRFMEKSSEKNGIRVCPLQLIAAVASA